eukprot:scaffold133126_cov63-Phaeocystis_antarctica.AAC.3
MGTVRPSVSTTNCATCGELTPGVLATSIPSSFAASMSIEPRLVPRRTSRSCCSCSCGHRSRQACKNGLETDCAETTIVVVRSGTSGPEERRFHLGAIHTTACPAGVALRRPASRLEEHRPRRAEAKGAVRAARDAVRLVRDIMAKDDSGGIRPCGRCARSRSRKFVKFAQGIEDTEQRVREAMGLQGNPKLLGTVVL